MPTRLEDKDAIVEVMAKYCHYLDAQKLDEWYALYADDCVWEAGPIGTFKGMDELKKLTATLSGALGTTGLRHLTNNHIVTVEGDKAHLSAYVTVLKAGENRSVAVIGAGGYEIDLTRGARGWLIQRVKLITL